MTDPFGETKVMIYEVARKSQSISSDTRVWNGDLREDDLGRDGPINLTFDQFHSFSLVVLVYG